MAEFDALRRRAFRQNYLWHLSGHNSILYENRGTRHLQLQTLVAPASMLRLFDEPMPSAINAPADMW
jgi:hypothetical protein